MTTTRKTTTNTSTMHTFDHSNTDTHDLMPAADGTLTTPLPEEHTSPLTWAVDEHPRKARPWFGNHLPKTGPQLPANWEAHSELGVPEMSEGAMLLHFSMDDMLKLSRTAHSPAAAIVLKTTGLRPEPILPLHDILDAYKSMGAFGRCGLWIVPTIRGASWCGVTLPPEQSVANAQEDIFERGYSLHPAMLHKRLATYAAITCENTARADDAGRTTFVAVPDRYMYRLNAAPTRLHD